MKMKVTLEIYDRCKYEQGAEVIMEVKYDIKSYDVVEMTDEEVYAEGFDEVDPYGEYLILRTMEDEVSTFRNSYCDMFRAHL